MAGKDVQSIITSYNNPDHNKLVGKKRKKQSEQKEHHDKENVGKNDEASIRKKPRLVWTAELHRKFVYTVNQHGLNKAYPRRLLELMNIEGLTKEHVASHLQSWIKEYGDFGTLFESRRILENKLPSYGSYGTCKMNSPYGMNLSRMNSFVPSQNILTSTETQNSEVFHSSVEASLVNVESVDTDICADLLEYWPNEAWSETQTQLSNFSVHSSSSSEVLNNDQHTHDSLNFSSSIFPSEKSTVDFSSQSDVTDF
ncbi:Myb domain, plant [Sesbania bispinosa]|nr:Myb domain, plant [Sesbania bispinosa]